VHIGIDASRCIADRLTGTERYSREVIAAILRIAPHHQYRLYFRATQADQCQAYLAALPAPDNIEPVIVPTQRLWTHIGLGREIARRPPEALFVPAHVLPALLPKSLHTVVTIHDVGYRHFPQAHRFRERLYLDRGTGYSARVSRVILVDSHTTALDVAALYHVDPGKIRIAYPGALPLPEVSDAHACETLARFGIAPSQPFALHVGTLQPRKNLRRLIEAWARAARPDGALLVLAGGLGWGSNDIIQAIDMTRTNPTIKLTGYISDEDKAVLLRHARAYLFPSLYEGFGFPMLEAQSAGVPVACSNTSSLAEIAGGSALLFDPLDMDGIAHAIERVLRDDLVRAQLTQAGRQNVARFTWQACARVAVDALTRTMCGEPER